MRLCRGGRVGTIASSTRSPNQPRDGRSPSRRRHRPMGGRAPLRRQGGVDGTPFPGRGHSTQGPCSRGPFRSDSLEAASRQGGTAGSTTNRRAGRPRRSACADRARRAGQAASSVRTSARGEKFRAGLVHRDRGPRLRRGVWIMSGSRTKPGPLGPFVDGYSAWLVERGYSPSVVVRSLVTLGHLGRWLDRNALAVDQLSAGAVSGFLTEYRDDRGRLPGASAWPLLEYLRAEGAVPPEPPAVLTPVERLVGEYREWLVCERGLAPVTVRASERFARRFLAGRVSAGDPCGVLAITAGEVHAFLVRECAWASSASAGCCTYRLRSLLGYLAVRGFADPGLAPAVPRVARWREATIRSSRRDRSSSGCWPRVTARTRPGRATTRSCCCSHGWGCARSKCRDCGSTISIGAPGRSSSMARRTGATSSRCPATSARRSSSISSIAATGAGSGACS